jgi:hypothetical protein
MLPVSKLYTESDGRMIDELESIWKEAIMTEIRYHSGIYVKGRKTTKISLTIAVSEPKFEPNIS